MTAAAVSNPLDTFLDRYADDPILFVREVWEAEPDEWQGKVLKAYGERTRRISIKSGHGVGKTTVLAWTIIHHAVCRFPQKTVLTAPTSKQLWDALWPEVKVWLGRLPPRLQECFVASAESIAHAKAPDESFISARTSRADQPEALAGVHSDYVLLIADEASGVPEQVFEAASGSMSGHNAITILTGNPVRGQGLFYDTHNKLADMWTTFTVSCFESRFVNPDYIEDMRRRYGEDSNAYRVRVLGEFPRTDDDTVIPFELVEAALDRDVQPVQTASVIWGLDPARFGSNRSALAKRRANRLMQPIQFWSGLDTMQLAGRVKHEYDMTPPMERPAEINVDVIGIGAGVVDRLRELGLPCRGINVSESPAVTATEKYRNLRAELWFKAREWFAKRDCVLNIRSDDDLIQELTTPTYKFLPNSSKLLVESKQDLKKRGKPSPDLADAFVLTFAGDAATLLHGSAGLSNWKKPLSRPLKVLV